jgi:hypothetical protein
MGTSIHMFVELRNENDGKWEVPNVGPDRPMSDRNYRLFGILREMRDFIETRESDSRFFVFTRRKGVPHDLSDDLSAYFDEMGHHYHSLSWILLSELMSFDWTQRTTYPLLVGPVEFLKWRQWRDYDTYNYWPKDYLEPHNLDTDVIRISEAEMEERVSLAAKELNPIKRASQLQAMMPGVYCEVKWTCPYYKTGKQFLGECVPPLWRLGKPENVRIVYCFDS